MSEPIAICILPWSVQVVDRQISGQKKDIRDLIKQCPNPNCGEIWFYVEACPNTACGQRPNSFWDYSIGRLFNRDIVRREGKQLKVVRRTNKSKLVEYQN